MIRNVIVRLLNDQPLLADLFTMPKPSDSVLICTNLRGIDGRAPTFIARKDGIFVFPLTQMRFVELPPLSGEEMDTLPADPAVDPMPEPETVPDDHGVAALAALAGGDTDETRQPPEGSHERSFLAGEADLFDDDLLRRIREI